MLPLTNVPIVDVNFTHTYSIAYGDRPGESKGWLYCNRRTAGVELPLVMDGQCDNWQLVTIGIASYHRDVGCPLL